VLVQLNDPLPEPFDAADLAFRVLEMVGVNGLAGGIVEVAGEGLNAHDSGARRRLLAGLAATGCITAVAAMDEAPEEAWGHSGGLPLLNEWRTDPDAVVDEILVVNARDVAPRVLLPEGRLAYPEALRTLRLARVLVGGCTGGDAGSLEAALKRFERRPPAPQVETFLVPASEKVMHELQQGGLADRAQRAGCPLLAPHQLSPPSGLTFSTSACLDRRAVVASPATIVASAHLGQAVGGA
jgi:homoaconitase/3-isopropylmalate dehydratase large subunit